MFRTRHQSAGRSHRWLLGTVAACALAAAAVLPGSTTTTSAAFETKTYQARHLVAAGTGQREEPRTAGGVNFLTGTVGGGQTDSDWTLSKNNGPRSTTRHVDFTVPFGRVPQVVIGLASIDTGSGPGVRITVAASNITRYGFDAVFTTWLDSVAYGLAANWIAIG